MSLVTSACLYVSYAPREVQERLLEPLPFDEREQAFRKVPWEASGGTKGMGADVYLAGFNYVLPSDLVEHVRGLLGDGHSIAVLIVEFEGDEPEVVQFNFEPAP